ncbi:response regulator transcription factor [Paenibacillus montanisoli]|uniref:DNA-binding response regulator n=1 Tax=Paenibacillus montanisoli TaxID=2081970 RepID=A0A328U9U2_9BACL|nr:response regulator [Paenibacillus montanisoli]RAP76994.1 DNA-binding response regulator [Paenibacillus montanisoli]
MYRLLIVDDEPVIVNGLVHLFQENADFELDIVKAYSANEALEIAKTSKLDIMVSDIRMPQKSGLQLVDEMVYYWPSCRIIFLTGYSEFEYVYEAIQKNVENYILKTEGMEPIFRAVKTALQKLDAEKKASVLVEKAQIQLQYTESLLKKEMLEGLLRGETIASLRTNPQYADIELGVSTARPAVLLVGQLDPREELASSQKWKTLQSIQQFVCHQLPASIHKEQMVYDASALVWLLQPDSELASRFMLETDEVDMRSFASYVKGVLESIQNECEDRTGKSVSFAVAGNLHNWACVHEHVEQACVLIRRSFSLGKVMVILDLDKPAEMISSQEKVIDQIHHYIQKHLSGNLSLTAIADEVHFNPSYLSRYYKQTTGRNLLDYIQSSKLSAAIAMMSDPQLKLNEIAVKLGFDSHSYFTTFFKRMTGSSPQDYRNTLRK